MKALKPFSARHDASPDSVIRTFQSESDEIAEDDSSRPARSTTLLLAGVFVALLVVAGTWRVDRVVDSIAGQLVTIDPTVVMQPLDPSIVKTIAVQEGERVKPGQVLATLDPTIAAADVDALRRQVAGLDAAIARCEAELAGRPYDFVPADKEVGQYYATVQQNYYTERKAQFDSQLRSYDAQIEQARATLIRYEADEKRYGERETLAKEIEGIRSELAAKQLDSRLLLLTSTDQKLEIARNIELDRNSAAVTRDQLDAAIATRDAYVQQSRAQTSQELVLDRTQHDSAAGLLEKARKHQDLVVLSAPDDAIVLRIAKVSVGSVLQPGESFIELALLNSPLEGEIYIDPRDIGFVRPGDKTVLKFDPYHYVEHGWATGQLRWISEGTFSSPQTGAGGTMGSVSTSPSDAGGGQPGPLNAGFYKARITIEKVDLHDVPENFRLLPGTTFSADIHVGTRSLFWYLARGMVRGIDESMREP